MSVKLPDLPTSDDEYWEGSNTSRHSPRQIKLCSDHGRKTWDKHEGYINNGDGTISCDRCPFGTKIPGYLRVLNGKIVDLRRVSSTQQAMSAKQTA